MKEIIITLYTAFLFVIFTPGFLFTVSKKNSKIKNTIIHAFLFAIVLYFTENIFWDSISLYEGYIDILDIKTTPNMAVSLAEKGNINNGNYPLTPTSIIPNMYSLIKEKNNINGNYPLACNEMNKGKINEQNYTCTEINNNYLWDLKCMANTIGYKNNIGQTCTSTITDSIINYNWR